MHSIIQQIVRLIWKPLFSILNDSGQSKKGMSIVCPTCNKFKIPPYSSALSRLSHPFCRQRDLKFADIHIWVWEKGFYLVLVLSSRQFSRQEDRCNDKI